MPKYLKIEVLDEYEDVKELFFEEVDVSSLSSILEDHIHEDVEVGESVVISVVELDETEFYEMRDYAGY